MDNTEAEYEALMSVDSLGTLDNEAALRHLGLLIDAAHRVRASDGMERAFALSDDLERRDLSSEERALLRYFVSNCWESRRIASEAEEQGATWRWDQHETEQEIFHLRIAKGEDGFDQLAREQRCQILTNLGNVLDRVGRSAESLEFWDMALALLPTFAMARGNRGIARAYYAGVLHHRHDALLFLRQAHADLIGALSSELDQGARRTFDEVRRRIESILSPEDMSKTDDLDGFSVGASADERRYREWCLSQRLFLNPLNDLGTHRIAAHDHLTAPAIVVGVNDGPHYVGFFNQMKQEFVSARYMYYEGINSDVPHFSDTGVLLYNTLDYPAYSLAVERVKAAFRTCYSLLDKVAFFLNHYLALGIPDREVSLRRLWYKSGKKKNGLTPLLRDRKNWPLRGLYWLSKDIYEDRPGFKDALEPDAREVGVVRQHLEHRYLKLHDIFIAPGAEDDGLADSLAFSLPRLGFEAKTLRLLKMARSALTYLCLAIHEEELGRRRGRDPKEILPSMPLDRWEDDWKR